MASRSLVVAFVVAQSIAVAAFAQSDEFGRASGGELSLITKAARAPLSGSLGISRSSGNDVFGGRNGYEATFGGTLIQDRLWFFATGSQHSGTYASGLQLPERAVTGAVDAKLGAQLGSAHDFSASYHAARMPALTAVATPFVAPSNFLSLRYTGIISSNMTFDASFSRSLAQLP